MAISRKPEADKLPVSQRINQRMENPKRRQATPTDWAIKGELFLNCSCTVFCPCVVSLGAHPPTEGHCHAWMAIAIDEGYYDCLLYTSPSPRDGLLSRMPSSA